MNCPHCGISLNDGLEQWQIRGEDARYCTRDAATDVVNQALLDNDYKFGTEAEYDDFIASEVSEVL